MSLDLQHGLNRTFSLFWSRTSKVEQSLEMEDLAMVAGNVKVAGKVKVVPIRD